MWKMPSSTGQLQWGSTSLNVSEGVRGCWFEVQNRVSSHTGGDMTGTSARDSVSALVTLCTYSGLPLVCCAAAPAV
mgnify:CR=1 FL=1